MASKNKILFIMNPISGTLKKAGIPKIVEETIDKGFYDYSIAETNYVGHACDMAKEARDNGYYAVIAVGGDGTVNEVARSLTHSNTALGIIPCGSGNGLARHLMLPMDVRKAVDLFRKAGLSEEEIVALSKNQYSPFEIPEEEAEVVDIAVSAAIVSVIAVGCYFGFKFLRALRK